MAVRNLIDPVMVSSQLNIDTNDLSGAFQSQSALFAYYSARHAEAERQEDQFKFKLEVRAANIDKQLRAEARNAGEKLSEPQIAKLVSLDRKYQEIYIGYIEAKRITTLCRATVEAFRQRRDMLIQMGSDQREEKKGRLHLNSNHNDRGMAVLRGGTTQPTNQPTQPLTNSHTGDPK